MSRSEVGVLLRAALENGLQVLVQRTDAAPLASLQLLVDAGTADERDGEHGAAHFLEHMLFKGTRRRGVGEAATLIEGMGGDLNAYTSHDQTVIHATVEASAWREALDVVVDMMREATLDPGEFEREKHVVLEEIRGYADEPETVVDDEVHAALFPDHAYGRPILGTIDSISAMRRDDVAGFWRRNYLPGRAVLAVAGDVDPQAVLAAARALLGDWAAAPANGDAPAAQADARVPGAAKGPVVRAVRREFETRTAQLAWRSPAATHADVPALDVLVGALGEGAASLLTARLQLEEGLASDVWATMSTRRAAGSISIGFYPREGKSEDAVSATLDELEKVARRGLPGILVQRARDAILADFLFAGETVDGVAQELAWYTVRFGDPAARERYRAAVAGVTPDDVRRVARTWLRPEHLAVVVLDKDASEKKLATRARKRVDTSPKPREAVIRKRLKNGARIVVLPDETPVMAVRVAAIGGGLTEQPRSAGMANAWSRMVTAGAADLDEGEFAEAIDDLAGEVEGVGGRSSLGLRATFPASHAADGIDLVCSALLEPWFANEEWERVREELLDEVRSQEDHPGPLASDWLWSLLWKGHPWRLPRLGTEASLKQLGPKALKHWHEKLVTGPNVVVAVAGGVEPDEVFEVLEPWLEELPKTRPELPKRDRPDPMPTGHRSRKAGREQAHVVVGTRGASLSDPDRHALDVAANVLGAQGGRLFLDLREKHGLAYSVWAGSSEGLDGGVFSAGLATDPVRATQAREALVVAVRGLLDHPPDLAEVERTKRMLVGHGAMGLQRASGRASEAALGELYGLPWGIRAYREEIARVTPDDVERAVRRVLAPGLTEVTVEPLT